MINEIYLFPTIRYWYLLYKGPIAVTFPVEPGFLKFFNEFKLTFLKCSKPNNHFLEINEIFEIEF